MADRATDGEARRSRPPATLNYLKARDLLQRSLQEMDDMRNGRVVDAERFERLQEKTTDLEKIFELVEREFDGVEKDDWHPKLTDPRLNDSRDPKRIVPRFDETRDSNKPTRPADTPNPNERPHSAIPLNTGNPRDTGRQEGPQARLDPNDRPQSAAPLSPDASRGVPFLGAPTGNPNANDRPSSAAASRYRPADTPISIPQVAPISSKVPRAPSPPPAVPVEFPQMRSSGSTDGPVRQAPQFVQPTQQEQRRPPPATEQEVDLDTPLPANITFDHGSNFTDLVASLELSDIVYDQDDAREDLTKAKEKLGEAQEENDNGRIEKYSKRITKIEKEIKDLDVAHWQKEVNPLRQAYRVGVLRCIRELDAAIDYTESLQGDTNPAVKTPEDQGQLHKLEKDALHDMALLKDWLQLSLKQPKTHREKDRLLVSSPVKGHPGRSLKDPTFVNDLLEEASTQKDTPQSTAQRPTGSEKQKPKPTFISPQRSRDDENPKGRPDDTSGATARQVAITPELLEGLINGAMPPEVASSIKQCQECKGTGGDLDHAKICSECDGAGSNKNTSDGTVELCPKCSGRGFRLSRKYQCPVCEGYKIVMNVPAQKGRGSDARDIGSGRDRDGGNGRDREGGSRRDRDTVSGREDRDAPPKRSNSTKRAAFDELEIPANTGRSRSKSQRNREDSPDSRSPSPPAAPERRPSSRRRKSEAKPADPMQSLTAALSAASADAMGPGKWSGDKGKRVLGTVLAAMAGGGAAGEDDDQSDSGRSEDDRREEKSRRKRRGSSRH